MPGYIGQSGTEDKNAALQSENNIFTCKKNDEFIIDIEDLGTDGEGIGKIQGYTLFVKDALTGDKVRVKIMKAKKHIKKESICLGRKISLRKVNMKRQILCQSYVQQLQITIQKKRLLK